MAVYLIFCWLKAHHLLREPGTPSPTLVVITGAMCCLKLLIPRGSYPVKKGTLILLLNVPPKTSNYPGRCKRQFDSLKCPHFINHKI